MDTTLTKTSLPRDFLYEFRLDKNLVQSFKDQCLASNIDYSFTSDQPNASEYGYPIVKNDELLDSISTCVTKVGNDYFNLPKEASLKINDMWITKTNLMRNSKKHFHCFSIFSGLLYLDNSDTETVFSIEDEFIKNYYKIFWHVVKPSTGNILKVKPELGKLIIWPSYVSHHIATSNSKGTRYTLAFNTFFDGVVSTFPTQRFSVKTDGPNFL